MTDDDIVLLTIVLFFRFFDKLCITSLMHLGHFFPYLLKDHYQYVEIWLNIWLNSYQLLNSFKSSLGRAVLSSYKLTSCIFSRIGNMLNIYFAQPQASNLLMNGSAS